MDINQIRQDDRESDEFKKDLQAAIQNNHLIDFTKVIEHFPTAVIVTDKVGYPVGYNQSAVDILGRKPANISPEDWP